MEERIKIITPSVCGLLRKVSIPAVLGDDTGEAAPKNGAYSNAVVVYEANQAVYLYSTDGIYTKLPGSVGPKGDKGEKGDTGPQGPAGPANVLSIGTVETGTHSSATITGTSPEQVLNLTLQKGDKGDTGNGIASAVLNADYTLTLTFTDGTSYTTPSVRGEQGPQGPQGPVGSYTAGDNISIVDNTISATDTTYTAGTGINISNGEISATRNDIADLLTSQGLDPNPSHTIQSITQQQYTAIYNFIDTHRNDGTMCYHGQTGGQSQGGASSGLPVITFDADAFSISEYSIEFEEDKGFGIGTVNLTTVGSMIMIVDGVLLWLFTIAHNIDTDDCFYINIATGGL